MWYDMKSCLKRGWSWLKGYEESDKIKREVHDSTVIVEDARTGGSVRWVREGVAWGTNYLSGEVMF